jgi:hypothetical protein
MVWYFKALQVSALTLAGCVRQVLQIDGAAMAVLVLGLV